jgi:hypothetical protein
MNEVVLIETKYILQFTEIFQDCILQLHTVQINKIVTANNFDTQLLNE